MRDYLSPHPKDCKIPNTGMKNQLSNVTAWYYEENQGFAIIVRVRENEYVAIEIPWRDILLSVGRYLKGKGKKITGGTE